MAYVIIYVAICFIVGWLADSTTLGFWGGFFLSLILTPVIGFIIYLFYPSTAHRDQQQQILLNQQQLLQQQLINQQNQYTPPPAPPQITLVQKLENLEELKRKNLVNDDEYKSMREKLMRDHL